MGTTVIGNFGLWCLNLRMVNKANEIQAEDKYGYIKSSDTEKTRLDLNDLLQRAKAEKKNDLKTNATIILSCAFAVVLVVVAVLSF